MDPWRFWGPVMRTDCVGHNRKYTEQGIQRPGLRPGFLDEFTG